MNKPSLLFLLVVILFSCQPSSNRSSSEQRSFCYWDTSFNLDTTLVKDLDINHMYIRYFDVDWDPLSEEAKPMASLTTNDSIPLNFTPSVFFTNKVFEKSSNKDLELLSTRVRKRVEEISANFGNQAYYNRNIEYLNSEHNDSIRLSIADEYKDRYSEVLIDCDWTEGTRDKFFYFLKCLKKDFSGKNITVTLRLWQYKRNKPEDVPPVDRCLLMCYNMQTANDFNVENSIASMNELKKYVSGKKYPVTLDVALPVFSWAVLFRNEKFIGLLGNATQKEYADNFIEYEDMGKGRYRSLVDKVIGNFFIRKGDIIRVEEVSKDELKQMADYLDSEIPKDKSSRITFFSWNKSYINNYGTDEIKNIYNTFSK